MVKNRLGILGTSFGWWVGAFFMDGLGKHADVYIDNSSCFFLFYEHPYIFRGHGNRP